MAREPSTSRTIKHCLRNFWFNNFSVILASIFLAIIGFGILAYEHFVIRSWP